MTLYEISEEYQRLYEMLEDIDADDEAVTDTIDSLNGEFEDKADNYGIVIQQMGIDADAIDKEIARLTEKKKHINNSIDRMKACLKNAMELTGNTKFKTEHFSFNIAKNGGKLPIVYDCDVQDLPDGYYKTEKKPDTEAIRNALDNPDFEDLTLPFHYGERGTNLRIR